jgi:hypothetical protein
VDDVVEAALLALVQPAALQAAQAAELQAAARRDEVREALLRDLQAARYAADRAFRQYDAADPENRFIAGELEARWNRALGQTAAIEQRIAEHDAAAPPRRPTTPISFADLAKDLGAVWSAPTTDARLKKRIVRTVIHEAIVDIDEDAAEIILVIHWVGGAHTEHRLPRRRRGQRNSTPSDVVEAVRQLALIMKDDAIAATLNRSGLKTGNGNRWNRERVTSMRCHHKIPVYTATAEGFEPWLTLSKAAAVLGVAPRTLRLAANRGEIDAVQPLADGPWLFQRSDLDGPAGKAVVLRARTWAAVPHPSQQTLFPSTT